MHVSCLIDGIQIGNASKSELNLLRIVRKSIVILAFQKAIEFSSCSLNGLFQTQQLSPAISLQR